MFLLFAGILAAAPAAPTWRVNVRDETTKKVQQVEASNGAKAAFVAGSWRCELVTFQEEPEEAELAVGRFTLTKYSGS